MSSWMFLGTLWLTIWKNPHDPDASLIFSTICLRFTGSWWTPARSMTGKMKFGSLGEYGVPLSRNCGGAWKIRGISLIPESASPFTPAFDSSNDFSSAIRS
ncbi:hypothetical protein LINPERHAP1_LOCUS20819 [Linum perenne]